MGACVASGASALLAELEDFVVQRDACELGSVASGCVVVGVLGGWTTENTVMTKLAFAVPLLALAIIVVEASRGGSILRGVVVVLLARTVLFVG